MVARVENEMLSQALLTPRPEVSDSDDVLLALETARALEMQGEFREAARWLRRAAEDAEEQGNDERCLTLARAAADLTSAIGSSPPAGDAITMPPPSMSSPPMGDAMAMPAITMSPASAGTTASGDAPLQAPTAVRPSIEPTIPPPASLPATSPPASASPATVASPPPDMPLTERSMRIGAIRVAIGEGSIRGVKSFYVERLDRGQPPPEGTLEAMLVFNGESDAEEDFDLLRGSDSVRPSN